jgi:hypothetical protein
MADMQKLFFHTARHPSAILFVVQVLGVLLYPMEEARDGHLALNIFGILVLCLTTRMVRRTPGLTWISVCIAGPVIVLLLLQMLYDLPQLLPWSSGLEALFYFYAAGSLTAYMMGDDRTTTDELFAAAATFTLLAWGFTHLFVMTQALQPSAFSDAGAAYVERTWSELNHLSFALLSSTGMGSVVAISSHARAIASLEMMVGLMYLAAVVARLIGFTIRPRL